MMSEEEIEVIIGPFHYGKDLYRVQVSGGLPPVLAYESAGDWFPSRDLAAAEAARLDGFETCEGLVVEMREAMAETEDKARAAAFGAPAPFPAQGSNVSKAYRHEIRAGALREAALAVRLGQARSAGKEGA